MEKQTVLAKGHLSLPEAGNGPGLLLLPEVTTITDSARQLADHFAEEGYVTLVPALSEGSEAADLAAAAKSLRKHKACTSKLGIVGFSAGGRLAWQAAARGDVDCAVAYYPRNVDDMIGSPPGKPIVVHFAAEDSLVPLASADKVRTALGQHADTEVYVYPNAKHAFANPHSTDWVRPAAALAHARTIGLLRRSIGPQYNLSDLWDQHLAQEFFVKDTDATMRTMVRQPYVNHVPTLTGGVGHDELRHFYATHFIPTLPSDVVMIPISRTVGPNCVVDEMYSSFTHDVEIDWMLPGVKPTGRRVEIAVVSVVNFRGPKLYHEHIYWDQASVLVQIGLLDPKGLPVAGAEGARKIVDPTLPSNKLMPNWRPPGSGLQ